MMFKFVRERINFLEAKVLLKMKVLEVKVLLKVMKAYEVEVLEVTVLRVVVVVLVVAVAVMMMVLKLMIMLVYVLLEVSLYGCVGFEHGGLLLMLVWWFCVCPWKATKKGGNRVDVES